MRKAIAVFAIFGFFALTPLAVARDRAVRLFIEPASGSYAKGALFNVAVRLDTHDNEANGVTAHLVFDSAKVRVRSVDYTGSGFDRFLQEVREEGGFQISRTKLAVGKQVAIGGKDVLLGRVTLEALVSGTVTLGVSREKSKVALVEDGKVVPGVVQVTEETTQRVAVPPTPPPSPPPAGAKTIKGWAWGSVGEKNGTAIGIGWIRFSSDTGEGADSKGPSDQGEKYSVYFDQTTGLLGGYAWNGIQCPPGRRAGEACGYGWLSFSKNNLAGCPMQPCEARLDLKTGKLSGWARFMSGPFGKGEWTGWLSLRGKTGEGVEYGVCFGDTKTKRAYDSGAECRANGNFLLSNMLSGWAWGDDITGWVNFRGGGEEKLVAPDTLVILDIKDNTPQVTIQWTNGQDYDSLVLVKQRLKITEAEQKLRSVDLQAELKAGVTNSYPDSNVQLSAEYMYVFRYKKGDLPGEKTVYVSIPTVDVPPPPPPCPNDVSITPTNAELQVGQTTSFNVVVKVDSPCQVVIKANGVKAQIVGPAGFEKGLGQALVVGDVTKGAFSVGYTAPQSLPAGKDAFEENIWITVNYDVDGRAFAPTKSILVRLTPLKIPAPVLLSVLPSTRTPKSELTLTWNNPQAYDRIQLFRKQNPVSRELDDKTAAEEKLVPVKEFRSPDAQAGAGRISYNDSLLAAGSSYGYFLKAYKGTSSVYSNHIVGTTETITTPPPPPLPTEALAPKPPEDFNVYSQVDRAAEKDILRLTWKSPQPKPDKFIIERIKVTPKRSFELVATNTQPIAHLPPFGIRLIWKNDGTVATPFQHVIERASEKDKAYRVLTKTVVRSEDRGPYQPSRTDFAYSYTDATPQDETTTYYYTLKACSLVDVAGKYTEPEFKDAQGRATVKKPSEVCGRYTEVKRVTTPPNAPSAAVATLDGTNRKSQINIAFTDNSNGEDGFEIHRKDKSGGYHNVKELAKREGTGTVTYEDKTLRSGRQYSYRVRAYKKDPDSNRVYSAFSEETEKSSAATDAVVTVTVGGSGRITGSGYDCTGTCSKDFPFDPKRQLDFTASETSRYYAFERWSGCDKTSGTSCTVFIDDDKNPVALYERVRFDLNVSVTGQGTVSGSGISCPTRCSDDYSKGSTVTLTASPQAQFVRWSGDCSGTATSCTLTMDSDRSASAEFKTAAPGASAPSSQKTASLLESLTSWIRDLVQAPRPLRSFAASLPPRQGDGARARLPAADILEAAKAFFEQLKVDVGVAYAQLDYASFFAQKKIETANDGVYDDKEVDPGTVYLYRIKACAKDLCSDWSPERAGMTQFPPSREPDPPLPQIDTNGELRLEGPPPGPALPGEPPRTGPSGPGSGAPISQPGPVITTPQCTRNSFCDYTIVGREGFGSIGCRVNADCRNVGSVEQTFQER